MSKGLGLCTIWHSRFWIILYFNLVQGLRKRGARGGGAVPFRGRVDYIYINGARLDRSRPSSWPEVDSCHCLALCVILSTLLLSAQVYNRWGQLDARHCVVWIKTLAPLKRRLTKGAFMLNFWGQNQRFQTWLEQNAVASMLIFE